MVLTSYRYILFIACNFHSDSTAAARHHPKRSAHQGVGGQAENLQQGSQHAGRRQQQQRGSRQGAKLEQY
jgi:hypothetical protein